MRAWAPSFPSDLDGCDDTDGTEIDPPRRGPLEAIPFAPPKRRLSTGSHAEFVGALVQEFHGSLASLKGASELLARRRRDLDQGVLADLIVVIDRQAARVAWLVRLLEAVDGDGSTRRVETVHGPTVARQAAAATELALEMTSAVERDGDVFPGDPERVRRWLARAEAWVVCCDRHFGRGDAHSRETAMRCTKDILIRFS